jgi:multiple sugar transport system substrate-binding protein
MMQTGKVAMDINGHWKVLDYSQMEMNWGMAALPKFKEPMTIFYCAPIVVFSSTPHPTETTDFYIYMHDPAQCDLFEKGLWMPVSADYYEEPEKTKAWLEGRSGVYPPEAYDVLIEYVYKHSPHQAPVYWLKNQSQIFSEAVNPAQSALWSGELSAQEAMDQAVANAAPIMQGRWN